MLVFRFLSLSRGIAAAGAALILYAGSAAAQAVITGQVANEEGRPVGGASVTIANTNLGTATGEDGSYRLNVSAAEARGQQAVVLARRIGYRPARATIVLAAGTHTQNFRLEADPLRLEEVVVTGVGAATERNKLTFAVGTVDEERLQAVPGRSAIEAIQGKVPAARLVPTSSQPGGEVAIRLRGATSIGGRQDPIIIVDGVITRFGLADIAPEDIERVEIIKGAAASSLYGSNAANGVVQVFTRRGRSLPEGTLRVTSRNEIGVSQMPDEMQFSRSHAFEVNEANRTCEQKDPTWTVDPVGNYCLSAQGTRSIKPDQIADNPFARYFNHWDALVNDLSLIHI